MCFDLRPMQQWIHVWILWSWVFFFLTRLLPPFTISDLVTYSTACSQEPQRFPSCIALMFFFGGSWRIICKLGFPTTSTKQICPALRIFLNIGNTTGTWQKPCKHTGVSLPHDLWRRFFLCDFTGMGRRRLVLIHLSFSPCFLFRRSIHLLWKPASCFWVRWQFYSSMFEFCFLWMGEWGFMNGFKIFSGSYKGIYVEVLPYSSGLTACWLMILKHRNPPSKLVGIGYTLSSFEGHYGKTNISNENSQQDKVLGDFIKEMDELYRKTTSKWPLL